MTVATSTEKKEAAVKLTPPMSPPPSSPSMPINLRPTEQIWGQVIQGIIYVLTFFLPLLFTTWTFEPLEFSKQMLMFVLITLALIAWLLKFLVLRSWQFVKTPLDLPILLFLGIYLLASIFSIDRVASFLGFYGSFSGNFFQILFLVLFYYLVVNNFRALRELQRLIGLFSFALALTLFYIVLQFFGAYLFPSALTHAPNFNTVGGLLMISLFSAFSIALSLGLRNKSWFSVFGGKLWRIIAIASAFLVLLTVNFIYAWVGLLVGLLVYMIFQLGFLKGFALKNLVTPLLLLIIVVAFLISQWVFRIAPFRNILNFNLPVEVRLDYETARPALQGSVSHSPILGSGPNTFLYAFSKYKDADFNLSPFWNVRFDKAPSEAAEYLVGTGILGLLAFEILSLIFIVYALYFMVRRKDPESWGLALALFCGFAVLWFAHWFFFFNTVLAFSLWLTVAGFMAVTGAAGAERIKISSFSFAASPRRTVSVVSLVSLSLVLMIVFLFFSFAVYAADIFYRQGLRAVNDPAAYDVAQSDFERTLRLNRFRPDYYLTYGEFLFLRINQELAKAEPNLALLQSWLAASINTSRTAVNLSPANWTAWERLANLYTFARPLVAGVDQFIIDSLLKATDADSKNPILWTELGQVYRLAARTLDPAVLGRGVDTDGDGLADEQEQVLNSDANDPDTNGNTILDGAEVLSGLNPAGSGPLPESFFSRYLKTDPEKLVKAEEAFKRAVALKEDYATAYYQLALTLEQTQKLDEAIGVMETVLGRFPANLTLKFELGRMYFNAGKVQEAARQFQDIVNLSPNNSNARYSLAVSAERLGQTKKALDEYRKVFELNPEVEALRVKVQQLEEQLLQKEQILQKERKRR